MKTLSPVVMAIKKLSVLTLIAIPVAINPLLASAAFDRSLDYVETFQSDFSIGDLGRFKSPGNLHESVVTESSLQTALNDADRKIQPEFKLPRELRPQVEFWMRIYTQYSSQQVVLFDSLHLGIYEVIDLRDLAKTSRNQVVYEILSKRRVDSVVAKYQAAFTQVSHHLAHGKSRFSKRKKEKPLSHECQLILDRIQSIGHKHPLSELKAAFKTIRGQRDQIISGIAAAESYLPQMEEIFKDQGIPTQLTRLSLVESSFNLNATSKVGASGVWQFMPNIGKKFLVIDEKLDLDERRSPLKSTLAAAKLLKWNHRYLGSWILAIISYNHGLSHLPRIRHLKLSERETFAEVSHLFQNCGKSRSKLGWASKSYYSEFLALLHAEVYRDRFYGSVPLQPLRPVRFERVSTPQTALQFAMHHSFSVLELQNLNADIQSPRQLLPKNYVVLMPKS